MDNQENNMEHPTRGKSRKTQQWKILGITIVMASHCHCCFLTVDQWKIMKKHEINKNNGVTRKQWLKHDC